MQNILIISNDSRIPSLVDFFQPLVRGQVHAVTDFDLGLKEVFDKRPVAVFIQSEIAGISGDAVAKHIKGLLRDDSPRLVLLRDAPDKPLASRHAFDDSIDLFLSLEEVARLTRSQLEKVAGLELLETPPSPTAPEPVAQAPEAVSAAGIEEPAPAKAEPAPAPAPRRPAAPKPATPPAATGVQQDSARKERAPLPKGASPSVENATPPAARDGALPEEPIVETPIHAPDFKARPTTSRIWLFLCVLLALLLGGAFVFAPRWFGVKQKPSTPVAKTVPAPPVAPPAAAPGAQSLPSIVPLNGRDPAYASARPGWERYLSPTLECLVFKEQGRVKAIQVIGREGGSLPEQTVTSLLREAFQSERYTSKGIKDQDGYQVEEGIVPGKGEILVYRKKGPGTVRAVVITWP